MALGVEGRRGGAGGSGSTLLRFIEAYECVFVRAQKAIGQIAGCDVS